MNFARTIAFAAITGVTVLTSVGCSVAREQQTLGSYGTMPASPPP